MEEIIKYTDEELLYVLKTAKREYWEQIDKPKLASMMSHEKDEYFSQFIELFRGTKIFADGEDALIFVSSKLDTFNLKENVKIIRNFLRDELGIDKIVIAIDNDTRLRLIEKFTSIEDKKSIPDANINKIDFSVEKLYEFFGEDIVEIID